jgi:radical SAM protein with 4Fe4S-binding SPASM domain
MASLSVEDWKQVLDLLKGRGVPHIIFTGGEATLHPALPELVAHSNGLGQIAGLNSNGRRFSQESFAATMKQSGLNHVQITLSSSRAKIHDAINGVSAFGQTVKGIENCLASGIHTITNTTLMRRNRDHAEEIIRFIHNLGIRTFAMNGMIYSGGGYCDPDSIPEQELPPLLIRVRDTALELGMRFLWYTPTEYCRMNPIELEIGAKRCNAAEYSICIEPNGDVLPCQSFYVSAGNILKDPWETIWNGELFRSFRDRELDPRWAGLPEKCWECPDLSICGGGCRIEREARDGVALHYEGACSSGEPSKPSFIPIEALQHIGKRAAGRGTGVR